MARRRFARRLLGLVAVVTATSCAGPWTGHAAASDGRLAILIGAPHGETVATAAPVVAYEQDEADWAVILAEFARWDPVHVTLMAEC